MTAERKIHLPDGIWTYTVGLLSAKIRTPNRKKSFVVHCNELVGVTIEAYERGQYKRTSSGRVLPSHVKDYILSNILKLPLPAKKCACGNPAKRMHDCPFKIMLAGMDAKKGANLCNCCNKCIKKGWRKKMDDLFISLKNIRIIGHGKN